MPVLFQKPKRKLLPDTQSAYLRFMRDYVRENKQAPSYMDMARAAGVSKSSARQAVTALMMRGLVARGPARDLLITPAGVLALRKSVVSRTEQAS
jgi:Mn-dependent DtxR family transcriptional regulator